MRLRHTLKIINWSAAGVVLAVLVIGKDKYFAWIGIVLIAAVCLHFLIETLVLLRRAGYPRRLSDLSEYKEHQPYQVKDLESALASEEMLEEVSIPVILSGSLTGTAEEKAPLTGKKALAWRLIAEPLEGMVKAGGQVLLVDSYWSEMSLRDATGAIRLGGPGVLDGSSLKERVFTLKNLQADLPDVAARVADGLGITEGKDSKSTRIALREMALFPSDKVSVYGKAVRSAGSFSVSGNDTMDDPGSLLVRAAVSPASSRIPRRTIQKIVFSGITLCLFAVLALYAARTVVADMFRPGGIFDSTHTGKVRLDLDGRPLRVTIGAVHWDLKQDDTTKGFALASDGADFAASRNSAVTVQSMGGAAKIIRNGDPEYPRWDGSAWLFEVRPAAAQPAATLSAAALARTGRLYVRNLTGTAVTIRILDARGAPVVDSYWSFAAYERAGDPQGSYLQRDTKPLLVRPDARLEITGPRGFLRILPLADAARPRPDGSWLLEILPELSAGVGWIYVRNSTDAPLDLWLLGSDDKTLYGDSPWTFEPREGTAENKGLHLQYQEKDILMTGREGLEVEAHDLKTLLSGTLGDIGSWRRGAWTIDLAKIAR